MKKKKQYILIKKYTIVRGLFYTILLQGILLIPIFNILFFKYALENTEEHECWVGIWYDYMECEVKTK
jgi:hypothetical protein